MSQFSRREFIKGSTAAAGLAAGWPARAGAFSDNSLHVLLRDSAGNDLPAAQIKTIIARDLANDPLPREIKHLPGSASIALGAEPIQISCRVAVPGFGEVYCYADNGGAGYSQPGTIDFIADASVTRRQRVRDLFDREKSAAAGEAEILQYCSGVAQKPSAENKTAKRAEDYASLAAGLHAGERLVLLAARRRINRLTEPRRKFLFGGLTAGRLRSPDFAPRFTELCNYGTLSWYIWRQQASETDPIDYSRMDQSLQWCVENRIQPKGFGYVYMVHGAVPEWMRDWPYAQVQAQYERVVETTMRRYHGRMEWAEIINEAHDKSNLFHYDHEQILQLTRSACAAARRGSPTVKRLINNCCLWGEYGRKPAVDGARLWSPWRYLDDCVKAKVEFETIGLQLYYPEQDLLEIERMLDRFNVFQRPLQISEISCNDRPGLDAASIMNKNLVPGWHGPWTETMQADWAEAIYTLCYSKPQFEGVTWWDMADYSGHFWPNGGLLHADSTPKESFRRLLALKKSWGL